MTYSQVTWRVSATLRCLIKSDTSRELPDRWMCIWAASGSAIGRKRGRPACQESSQAEVQPSRVKQFVAKHACKRSSCGEESINLQLKLFATEAHTEFKSEWRRTSQAICDKKCLPHNFTRSSNRNGVVRVKQFVAKMVCDLARKTPSPFGVKQVM